MKSKTKRSRSNVSFNQTSQRPARKRFNGLTEALCEDFEESKTASSSRQVARCDAVNTKFGASGWLTMLKIWSKWQRASYFSFQIPDIGVFTMHEVFHALVTLYPVRYCIVLFSEHKVANMFATIVSRRKQQHKHSIAAVKPGTVFQIDSCRDSQLFNVRSQE